MSAEVGTLRANSHTTYKITGALADVFAEIETIFIEYDPRGYGTQVRKIWMDGAGPNYTAEVWRANSCD